MTNQKKAASGDFISGMSWLGAFLTAVYGYSINESWETALWYGLVGFGLGSFAGTLVRGILRWIVMTVVLFLAIIVFKERIELVFNIDLDPLLSTIWSE